MLPRARTGPKETMVQRRNLLVAVVACVPLAACGTVGPAPSPAPAPVAAGPTPSGTDIAWLQLLIAMNERIIPVLDLVPARAADPGIRTLAAAARRTWVGELTELHGIAEWAVLPTANPHEGHDMPGMVTADQLAALDRAHGPAFDRLFAAAYRAHLDQAARLCTAEQRSGADPAVKRLAGEVGAAVAAEQTRASALSGVDGADARATASP
jgi:uncharacterized protein (DUF305 family)